MRHPLARCRRSPRSSRSRRPAPCAGRSTTCARTASAIGSVLVVPFGHRDVVGVVVDVAEQLRAARRAARRAAPRARPRPAARARRRSPSGWPTSTARRPPARSRSSRRRRARARSAAWWAQPAPAPPPQERAADRAPAGAARRAAARGRAPTCPRCAAWRRAGSSTLERRAARRHVRHARRRAPRRRRRSPPTRRARSPRSRPRWRSARAARRCSCTASPARARPRSTCAPRRPRSSSDRGVIVLVPEIALTPQIVSRFVDRFGDTVAVLHSKLAAGERHDEWSRLRAGNARVCVGPRSAVFAPIERLGLIVVDEEHDGSYKHEGDPRYDARHVAARRAAAGRRPARRRQRDAAAGERPRAAPRAAARARRRPAAAAGPDRRHARAARRAAPGHEPRARRRAEGDRAAQPARLVELRRLPLVRARLDVPAVRRRARPAPRRGTRWPATTAATASACRSAA